MAEDNEAFEIEVSEDDIVYYIWDEDDNEIGFAVMEDGKEVEYYYEWVDKDNYAFADEEPHEEADAQKAGSGIDADAETAAEDEGSEDAAEKDGNHISVAELAELDGETVEMEISEEDIDHYLFDEKGNEIGFVIIEDGVEVECYYQEDDDSDNFELVDENKVEKATETAPTKSEEPAEPEEHGYLYKMAQIVGHEANKTRKKAQPHVENARTKATEGLDKVRSKAEVGVDKATEAVEEGGKKLKEKSDEYDLGITREGVSEATADLNAIAKEGAATAKELKEAYDDIMDSFGFLMPKGVRRKLP